MAAKSPRPPGIPTEPTHSGQIERTSRVTTPSHLIGNRAEKLRAKSLPIKLLGLDVDGVLTDGRIYYSDLFGEIKCFHTQDGLGLKLLQEVGIKVGVISNRKSRATELRLDELGITQRFLGNGLPKIANLNQLCKQLGLQLEEVAYIGDDLPDLPVIKAVGFGIAVANAVPEVRKYADYVTLAPGGMGAVREVCDLLRSSRQP